MVNRNGQARMQLPQCKYGEAKCGLGGRVGAVALNKQGKTRVEELRDMEVE